jgi:hypothetical protein
VHAGPDALKHTDIAQHALEVLGSAGQHLKRVVVAGRRGHIQVNHRVLFDQCIRSSHHALVVGEHSYDWHDGAYLMLRLSTDAAYAVAVLLLLTMLIRTEHCSFSNQAHIQCGCLSSRCRRASLSRSCESSPDLRYDSYSALVLMLAELIAVLHTLQTAPCSIQLSNDKSWSKQASTCSKSSCVHSSNTSNCCALQHCMHASRTGHRCGAGSSA